MMITYMPLPNEFYEDAEELSAAEYGRLIRAGQEYVLSGREPKLEGNERFLWKRLKGIIDRTEAREQERHAEKSSAARKAAESRWNRPEECERMQTHEKNADACERMQTHKNDASDANKIGIGIETGIENIISDSSTPTSVTTAGRKKAKSGDPEGFLEFWQAYPNSSARADAVKAWKKLNPDAELQKKIISAVEEQRNCAQWQRDGGQYIPHAATWLNGERWNDNPPKAVPKSGTGIDRSQSNGVPGQHERDAVARLIRQHRGENNGQQDPR